MSDVNPYAAPVAEPSALVAPSTAAPTVRLYGPRAIATHAFLFSPLAGAIMAAINFRRLGERARARNVLVLYGGLTLVLFVLAGVAPESASAVIRPVSFAFTIGCASMLSREQQPLFAQHTAAGGPKASWIPATLVSLAVIALVVGVCIAIIVAAGV